MKSLLNVFSFAVVTILLAACSASKPLTMDMALDKGATFDYATTISSDMNMSIMGQDMSTTSKFNQDYNFMVKNVQPTGVTEVDFKIDRITADMTVPMMGNMSYDSQKKDGAKDSPFAGLNVLVGKTMTANFDKKGKVTQIEGADILAKEMMSKVKGGEQIASMLESFIGEEAFKNIFMNLTGFSQGKPLKVGDSWTRDLEISNVVTMNAKYNYVIKEREGGKVTIDVTGTTKTDPNAKPIETNGVKISGNFSGPINGVIVVDEKTGWAISSNIQQDLSGKMTIGGTPMGDMTMDAKLKIGSSANRQ